MPLTGLFHDVTFNGRNTHVPGPRNEWVLNDTYPDKQRLQHPYLYHLPTRRKVPLGQFPQSARVCRRMALRHAPAQQPRWPVGLH